MIHTAKPETTTSTNQQNEINENEMATSIFDE